MSGDPPPFPLDARLCFNVYALNLALGRFYQQTFGGTGFTYPKFLVLLALREGGALSLSDLSARIGAEANTLSPLVKKMGAFGLLDRTRDVSDERRVLITVTPFGREVLEAANAVVQDGWTALGIDDSAVAEVNTFLEDARARVEATPPTRTLTLPDPPPEA